MKNTKRLLSFILILTMVLSFAGAAFAVDAQSGDIVILATNDIHNGVDAGSGTMGYANLAAYVAETKAAVGDDNVTLIDAGDSIQGEAIGAISKGEYLIEIMNHVGVDIAVPGNHEYDFGMERFLELAGKADFPYVSANFVDLKTDKSVFDAYKIITYGDTKVAYIGLTTPETFTKSTPAYFQDANGKYIYGFCEGNNGADLYACTQSAIDAAKADGADYIVVVGHLGIDTESSPWTSKEVIAATTGIDVFIDGHSHSTINGDSVADKSGKNVLLVQAGTKLAAIDKVIIKPNGTISAELVTGYTEVDKDTDAFVKAIQDNFTAEVQKVVAKSDVELYVNDPVTGKRIIRHQETNLGDLCADAYRSLLGTDIGFVNGGGIRANIPAGDITLKQIIDVHPFNNTACSIEATGQQILDALEMGSRANPGESGGFLHVSGITYTIDTTIKSTVVTDDKGEFIEVSGERRVKNVKIGGVAIDPNKTYTVASHNYMLKLAGDGYTMFKGTKVLQDEIMVDNQVLISYIVDKLGGVVGSDYANPYGQGRISITTAFSDVFIRDWFASDVAEAAELKLISGVGANNFEPYGSFTRAMLVTLLYRLEGSPAVEASDAFKDVPAGEWYSDAVAWAFENGIVKGYGDDTFAPFNAVSRQDMATTLYRYAEYAKLDTGIDEDVLASFKDTGIIADYALEAMEWAVTAGLIKGDANMLTPVATANRAQGATILLRTSKLDLAA